LKITQECVGCIINQSLKVANAIGADEKLTKRLFSYVEQESVDFAFTLTPPEIAAGVYAHMAVIANKKDLYATQKAHATQHATSFLPVLQTQLAQTNNKLLMATKIAVAGNVIDLAAQVEFDLEQELASIFQTDFAHNDFELLQNALETAKDVVVLGDNVGEHIFDLLFVQTLQQLYPALRVHYFVRGCPIINDVTMKEAKEAGFDRVCNLVDSGVPTPGFAYDKATPTAQKLFDNADVVVSKGMGNYECLSPSHRDNIFFLLKVKCDVVANSLGQNLGDIICKRV